MDLSQIWHTVKNHIKFFSPEIWCRLVHQNKRNVFQPKKVRKITVDISRYFVFDGSLDMETPFSSYNFYRYSQPALTFRNNSLITGPTSKPHVYFPSAHRHSSAFLQKKSFVIPNKFIGVMSADRITQGCATLLPQ